MGTITAQMVKDLRGKTDLPMMECKQALCECDGDIPTAMDWLRKRHKGKMTERADRATGEGRVGVFIDDSGETGAIIELQCETAPVAKNEIFLSLVDMIARKVASGTDTSPSPQAIRDDPEVESLFTDVFGKLRETMNLARCRRVTGTSLSSYVHHDGKSGVLLALDAKPSSNKKVGGDLCMHALFTQPLSIDRSGVPAADIEKVRNDAIEMAKEAGKPEAIVAKIADGKVNAFYGERVLMEQLHVKTDDYGKKKISDCLKEAGVNAVTDLVIMKIGG